MTREATDDELAKAAGDGDIAAARALVERLDWAEKARGVVLEDALAEHDRANPRYCENERCGVRLVPGWPAVYCSNSCALDDA